MLKKGIALLLIICSIYISFDALLPNDISTIDTNKNQFSTARALAHLTEISKKPHFVGNAEHKNVRNYIEKQLQNLGLETQIQEGYTISQWGNLAKAKNIIAKIKGSTGGKALMLLTHYDSNPHSSLGASDAGSGVVTILEGLRAYLSEGKTPKNDIIILISDAEELGLNGADLFVNQHEWAKNVGLVLNFEARGSGGPSYMLIETNDGNANLMKAFVEANPKYPVANSLAYSIYKMLPNDTDLTVFRKDGDINGFNFAFIDDHFDYHTALDTYDRLDRNTLEHQGSYLMPLLHYFADANLKSLRSKEDYIYFNAPYFGTVIYPFNWILPMLILAIVAFIGLLIYGFKNRTLKRSEVTKGFYAFIICLIICGIFVFLSWKLINNLYPGYGEMLHGFTYNGHSYIWCFVFLSLGIIFYSYHKIYSPSNTASLLVAPITLWLIICTLVAFNLKGASFFIIPVMFALLAFFVLLKQQKPSLILLALLCIPVLFIITPLIKMFPVGLGLKILFVSAIFVVLIFGFTLPVFGFFKHKKRWSYLLFLFGIVFFFKAHFNSKFTADTPKPNSLVYILNNDDNTALWATYDNSLDSWTKNFLGETPEDGSFLNENIFNSKYASGFTYVSKAPLKAVSKPKIEISNDTLIGNKRHFNICIMPTRAVQRMELFSDSTNVYHSFKINGVDAYRAKASDFVFETRKHNRLFSYYVSDNEPLELFISVPANQKTTIQLHEATFDLLENNLFTVPKREENMIPKPFVLNDAILTKQSININ